MGEPPVLVDPRRWGSLIGVAGGLWFILGYAPALGTAVTIVSGAAGIGLALTVLFGHFVRPTSLGEFREPRRVALIVYVGCVAAELAAIAVGSRLLTDTGHAELRPALIAGVVGLHFLPFAWAFGERMFYTLGLALLALGSLGLIVGYAGVAHAAEVAAVLSGLVMLVILALYAGGRFSRRHGRSGDPRERQSA